MMGQTQSDPLCPRCYAPLDAGAGSCRRCGVAVLQRSGERLARTEGAYCPRCDRLDSAGGHFVGEMAHGTGEVCIHCGTGLVEDESARSVAYEERSLPSPSFDLDRLARAEAVDGWTLVDTTIDPQSPGRVLAHFRRALSSDDPRARALRPDPARPADQSAPRVSAPVAAGRASTSATPTGPVKAKASRAEAKSKHASPASRPSSLPGARQTGPTQKHGSAELDAFLATMLRLAVTVGATILRHVIIPLAIMLATVFREFLIDLTRSLAGSRARRRQPRRSHWRSL